MADDQVPRRPRRGPSGSAAPPAGGAGRPPVQFSLWSLGVFVTVVCVVLGALSLLGNWLGAVFVLVVALVFRVMAPVAVVVAAIYCRGYVRTFFLGVAIAIAVQQLTSGSSLSSPLAQGQFDGLSILRGLVVGLSYLASGVLAVAVRRAVESRGWDRPSDAKPSSSGSNG